MSKLIKTGVIGHPIKHSKSPIIHEHWIAQHNLNATYELIDIVPDNFERDVKNLMDQGYMGANITIPHKNIAYNLCDHLDETAIAIGAVNTIKFENGKIFGMNTDAFGFIENLYQLQPTFNPKGKTAFVIGAGGAAKAILHALKTAGVNKIIITNRTQQTAEIMAQYYDGNINIIPWDAKNAAVQNADVIVNTTALGMAGYPDLDIDLKAAKPSAVVYDIVYNPLITSLLHQAQQNNLNIVTGIGMLLHQARPGFELWHGIMPHVDKELEQKVLV